MPTPALHQYEVLLFNNSGKDHLCFSDVRFLVLTF